MTTGRINQIANPCGRPGDQRARRAGRQSPEPRPRWGPECSTIWKGRRTARPRRGVPAHRGPHAAIHLPPRKALQDRSARRGARHGALSDGDGLRHTVLGWGVRTPRSRRRTAATVRRLPPGIWASTMASGHGPTDSSDARDQTAPRLRSPRSRTPTRTLAPASSERPPPCPRGGPALRTLNPPGTERQPIRHGSCSGSDLE